MPSLSNKREGSIQSEVNNQVWYFSLGASKEYIQIDSECYLYRQGMVFLVHIIYISKNKIEYNVKFLAPKAALKHGQLLPPAKCASTFASFTMPSTEACFVWKL